MPAVYSVSQYLQCAFLQGLALNSSGKKNNLEKGY